MLIALLAATKDVNKYLSYIFVWTIVLIDVFVFPFVSMMWCFGIMFSIPFWMHDSHLSPKFESSENSNCIQCNSSVKTTARGFEPLRAEPNGFRVHHLNHSVTLSCLLWVPCVLLQTNNMIVRLAFCRKCIETKSFQANVRAASSLSANLMLLSMCSSLCGVAHRWKEKSSSSPKLFQSAFNAMPMSKRQRGDLNPCGQSPMDF